MEGDGDDLISLGSLFHDKGLATAKAPMSIVRYLGTAGCGHDPDRKPGLRSARVER